MSVLLIVETSDVGARFTAEAARALGFEPLFLCDLGSYQADTRRELEAYPVLDGATGDAATLARRVRAHLGERGSVVGGVITLLDSRLCVARELAERLGCPGLDPAVDDLKDKARVAALIPEFSPRSISFERGNIPWARIEAVWRESARGIVLKPRATAGAIGFTAIPPGEELRPAVERALASAEIPGFLSPDAWLCQELLSGELCSLEGYVLGGRVHPITVSGRRKVGSTESQLLLPYEEHISSHAVGVMQEAVACLVHRAGLRYGYFHCEFLVDGDVARLIDANMGRLGGGSMGPQLALSLGLDPVTLYSHVLRVSLGLAEPADHLPSRPARATWGLLYGMKEGGFLKSVHVPEGSGCHHLQILETNQAIPRMGQNNWSWVGMLWGITGDVAAGLRDFWLETPTGREQPAY
ncbi:hypothetical protein NR798_25680 [Archangium gephyra]|uniref:ATP-grasp domain-containing protein n=1 Tax=Archangium gephyra TaxID=48 RepID=UPI0035D4C6E7